MNYLYKHKDSLWLDRDFSHWQGRGLVHSLGHAQRTSAFQTWHWKQNIFQMQKLFVATSLGPLEMLLNKNINTMANIYFIIYQPMYPVIIIFLEQLEAKGGKTIRARTKHSIIFCPEFLA